MRLEKFRVGNYRSVKDSGWVDVAQQTIIVGRNESGKSNVLLALRSLRPPEGLQRLSVAADFPADRPRTEYTEEIDVIRTVWSLTPRERETLTQIFPRAREVTQVEVGRGFEPLRWVRFPELEGNEAELERARKLADRMMEVTEADEDANLETTRAVRDLSRAVAQTGMEPRAWAESVREALGRFRNPQDLREAQISEEARSAVSELGELVDQVTGDPEAEHAARDWVLHQLPTFLYLDDYPEIQGHQDLAAFVERKRENRPREEDVYFEKLLTVAGLDPNALDSLLAADHETRRQIANRAGATVTRRLREIWHERALKVRFNLDGSNFNTLISDPNSIYDVEVNLNERSRGFRWFFSFYVTFAADAKAGSTENMILLLDEPGLHLHALGQRDLVEHFRADFPNQILFSTHSPFLVPPDDLASVRTVTISEENGTTAHNTPAGDEKTLFPIVHSVGVEISKGLFGDGWSLAVPELTDYWYLQSVLDYLRDKSRVEIPRNLKIVPAGGCARMPFLSALLTGQHQNAVVLLSEDPSVELGDGGDAGEAAAAWLKTANAVVVGDVLPDHEGPADIEDLFEAPLYDRFVRYCYRKELEGKTLRPDTGIPRLVDRYTAAFEALGIDFSRARQARLFLRGMGKNPTTVLTKNSREAFERLYTEIRRKIDSLRD